jgi:hypothetical protein
MFWLTTAWLGALLQSSDRVLTSGYSGLQRLSIRTHVCISVRWLYGFLTCDKQYSCAGVVTVVEGHAPSPLAFAGFRRIAVNMIPESSPNPELTYHSLAQWLTQFKVRRTAVTSQPAYAFNPLIETALG